MWFQDLSFKPFKSHVLEIRFNHQGKCHVIPEIKFDNLWKRMYSEI